MSTSAIGDLAAVVLASELADLKLMFENGRGRGHMKSLDERGGAQQLVRDQYFGRYPFELLQNANDAATDAGRTGRALFELTDTALIVADDGTGFGQSQVDAICSLGRSSKGPGTSVGHKGLGFKAVGEITDGPQIISAQTWFQFDAVRLRNLMTMACGDLEPGQRFPVYAFPFPVQRCDLGPDADTVRQILDEGFTTVIRLPLREGVSVESVAADLTRHLVPRLLLFLHGIRELEVRGTDADFVAEVAGKTSAVVSAVELSVVGEAAVSIEKWLLYRSSIPTTAAMVGPLGEAWKDVESAEFGVAVPVNDDGALRTDQHFPLHVYFPTEEEPGLHVAVHGQWVLSMDRRHLAATAEALAYNRAVLDAVAAFVAAQVIPDLVARTGATPATVAALLPSPDGPQSEGAVALRRRWFEALLTAEMFPCLDGTCRTPDELILLPATVQSLDRVHGLADLPDVSTLRHEVEAVPSIRRYLHETAKSSSMTDQMFLEFLRVPESSTLEDYYTFLVGWRAGRGPGLVDDLKKVPCVLTGVGAAVPDASPLFFPRRGDDSIPDDIPVPIVEVPRAEGAVELLKEVGVNDFEWRELIRLYLIRILERVDADEGDRERALRGLRAYQDASRGGEELASVLARVRLPARTSNGVTAAGPVMQSSGTLYFGLEWTGSSDLERIYGPFGRAEFLDVDVPTDGGAREEDRAFYRMLGVSDHPRVEAARPENRYGHQVGAQNHPHRGTVFRQWMAQPDVAEAAKCPEGHPNTQYHQVSLRLDRFDDLIASQDPARLLALWNQLAARWGTVYEPAQTARFRCGHSGHTVSPERACPSIFGFLLQSSEWVPVGYRGVPEIAKPNQAWIDSPDLSRNIRNRVRLISTSMYQSRGATQMARDLGLTDGARPDVPQLLEMLEAMAGEADETGEPDRNLQRAARWVQSALNDALRFRPAIHPDPHTVRVLTTHAGVKSFQANPPFADDTFLRETWERRRPVLDAEPRLTRLTEYLNLTALDVVAVPDAMPNGVRTGGAFEEARRKIDRMKPYLLALATAEISRGLERVRPALKQLELVVCDELHLRYTWDGDEVTRPDATCFIAARDVPHGRQTRRHATAYLELDAVTGEPDWFAFGRQFAQHLVAPTLADAITMLLKMDDADRARLMADRNIDAHAIAEAHSELDLPSEDEEEHFSVVDALLASADPSSEATGALQALAGQPTEFVVPAAPPQPDGAGPAETVSGETSNGSRDSAAVTSDGVEAAGDQQTAPPYIDLSGVRLIDGSTAPITPATPTTAGRSGGSLGGYSRAPAPQGEDNARVGKRGERVVVDKLRQLAEQEGRDPGTVVWVSEQDELAPYDVMAIENNQRIYIEVKSTRSVDPETPFYVSLAELLEASLHGDSYYLYRVTDVDSATPTITRVSNPMQHIKDGHGTLALRQATMRLRFASDPDPDAST